MIYDPKKLAVFPPDAPASVDPTRMMSCARANMRVTVAGCARMFAGAALSRPAAWEGRAMCVGCPVGSQNVGQPVSPLASLSALLEKVCSRCLKTAPRLINGRYCVSCYNRQGEADRGRNAKGSRPRIYNTLHRVPLAVSNGAAVHTVIGPPVISATEALIVAARKAKVLTVFGWGIQGPRDIVQIGI